MASNADILLEKPQASAEDHTPYAAIVDFGMGNLFSILQACTHVGLQARITHQRAEILNADGLILPGVGAFGDAMVHLKELDLTDPLRDFICSGRPFLGICLGMQLLMTESEEFGRHRGLDVIPGSVLRLPGSKLTGENIKVPQVGWNRIRSSHHDNLVFWETTPLRGIPDGEYMYFVHSFYVKSEDPQRLLAETEYESFKFCSALRFNNISAFQFHPEKSGPLGIKIYENWSRAVTKSAQERSR